MIGIVATLCKCLHLYGFFTFCVLGSRQAGAFLVSFLINKKLGNLRGGLPNSALQQSSRTFRKILSVDQGTAHCFAGRLKDGRNWLGCAICECPAADET